MPPLRRRGRAAPRRAGDGGGAGPVNAAALLTDLRSYGVSLEARGRNATHRGSAGCAHARTARCAGRAQAGAAGRYSQLRLVRELPVPILRVAPTDAPPAALLPRVHVEGAVTARASSPPHVNGPEQAEVVPSTATKEAPPRSGQREGSPRPLGSCAAMRLSAKERYGEPALHRRSAEGRRARLGGVRGRRCLRRARPRRGCCPAAPPRH